MFPVLKYGPCKLAIKFQHISDKCTKYQMLFGYRAILMFGNGPTTIYTYKHGTIIDNSTGLYAVRNDMSSLRKIHMYVALNQNIRPRNL